MAGLPWIELHVGLPRHPKAIRLGRLVGDERAWAYMAQIWLWCAEECPGGVVAGEDAGLVLEHAAGWRGEPGKLASAAVAVGFLDEVAGGLVVHGWGERAAAHLAKRGRDAERQRKRYERITRKFAGGVEDSRGEHAENDWRTSGGRSDLSGNNNPNPNPNPNLLPSEEDLPPAGADGAPVSADCTGREDGDRSSAPPISLHEETVVQPALALEVAPGSPNADKPRRRTRKAQNAAQEAESAPRRALSDALVADWLGVRGGGKYEFAGSRDGKALDQLIERAGGDIQEIRRRWRWGIDPQDERHGGPPWGGRCTLISHLAEPARWNALDRAPALPAEGGRDAFAF